MRRPGGVGCLRRVPARLRGRALPACELLLIATLAIPAPSPAGAVYRWVDERGLVHYSDRVPVFEQDAPSRGPDIGLPEETDRTQDAGRMDYLEEPSTETRGRAAEGGGHGVEAPQETPDVPECDAAACQESGAADGEATGAEAEQQGDIAIGMTRRQVIETWGNPDRTGVRTTPSGELQDWMYDEGPGFTQHVYFRSGKVVRVQTPVLPHP
jgi:uncharacterized protein DUF4124/uncharacterized protein DUF2845